MKNTVATYGNYIITEEVNCYCVWYIKESNTPIIQNAFPFEKIKDSAFDKAKEFTSQHQ